METDNKIHKIGFIGSGRVATKLADSFVSKGFDIIQVFSPNHKHAQSLASKVNARAINSMDSFDDNIDLIIISIVDSAISQLDLSKINSKTIICHTSGSVDIKVLSASENYGVFYPLQTFSHQGELNISNIPICVEANNMGTLKRIKELASSISNDVSDIDSQKRAVLHLAAVFVCNFTNAMYSIGEQILDKSDISFDLLRPLIEETANKVQSFSPKEVQTGPALRNDISIMEKHIYSLQGEENYINLYKLMSKIIIDNKDKK